MTASIPTLAELSLREILDLVERFDTRGPRYTSYPTVPVWQAGLPAEAFDLGLERAARAGQPIAIYVHLPFCARRCLYCGCSSFVTGDEQRIGAYVDALQLEIERVGAQLRRRSPVQHLHLGGGTPTQVPAARLAGLLDHFLDRFAAADGAERSVEIDPRGCTDEHLQLLADRGFTRISLGVQDIDPQVQQAVRRIQPPELIAEVIDRARAAGFTSLNIDLIYGLPRQSLASWQRSLEAIVRLGPQRLACFGYAHLPARMKHQRAIDEAELPSAEERLQMLLYANRFFADRGYEPIGLDHFAVVDDELARALRDGRLWRSFMGYTATGGLELVALGCSAISELEELFCQNEIRPESYAELISSGRSALVRGHRLDDDDRFRKALIADLMCNLRIRPRAVSEQQSLPVPQEITQALGSLGRFERHGLLVPADSGYRVTPVGQLFLRNIAMVFDRYLAGSDRHSSKQFSRTI